MQDAGHSKAREEHVRYLAGSIADKDCPYELRASASVELANYVMSLNLADDEALCREVYRVVSCAPTSTHVFEGGQELLFEGERRKGGIKKRSRSKRGRQQKLDLGVLEEKNKLFQKEMALALSSVAFFVSVRLLANTNLDDSNGVDNSSDNTFGKMLIDRDVLRTLGQLLRWDDIIKSSDNICSSGKNITLDTIPEGKYDEDNAKSSAPVIPKGDPTKRGRRKKRRFNQVKSDSSYVRGVGNSIQRSSNASENDENQSDSFSLQSSVQNSPCSSTCSSILQDTWSLSSASNRSQWSSRKHLKQMEPVLECARKVLEGEQIHKADDDGQGECGLSSLVHYYKCVEIPKPGPSIGWFALRSLYIIVRLYQSSQVGDKEESEGQSSQQEKSDPLYLHNLFRECDTLPHLAVALKWCCVRLIRLQHSVDLILDVPRYASTDEEDINCFPDRIYMLTDLVDNLCFMCPDNRSALCMGTGVVEHLVRLIASSSLSEVGNDNGNESFSPLKVLHNGNQLSDENLLSCLKAVTSLTHENRSAGEQLTKERSWCQRYVKHGTNKLSCLSIILRLLEETIVASTLDSTTLDQKFLYDYRIFCLNILTNVTETCKSARFDVRRARCFSVPGQTEVLAVRFLVLWFVEQTLSFQTLSTSSAIEDGVTSNTDNAPASNPKTDVKKDVKTKENGDSSNCENDFADADKEALVLAGNGFLLLACLIKKWDDQDDDENCIRDVILSKVPTVEGSTRKVDFVVKTLKAFLNFYHLSIGAISAAVISPMLKLITDLEQI